MYVKKSIEPSKKPERKRFAIERTPIPSSQPQNVKLTQPAALRNLRENSHGIMKRLAPGEDLTFWTRSPVIYNP